MNDVYIVSYNLCSWNHFCGCSDGSFLVRSSVVPTQELLIKGGFLRDKSSCRDCDDSKQGKDNPCEGLILSIYSIERHTNLRARELGLAEKLDEVKVMDSIPTLEV